MENNNALVNSSNGDIFCSFTPETVDGKKKLYKAMTNPDHKVSDYINKAITVRDIVVTPCQFTDEETGEVTNGVRSILIDKDGVSYGCSSSGVFNALKTAIAIFGMPTWDDGITFKVTQISKNQNRIITLEIA